MVKCGQLSQDRSNFCAPAVRDSSYSLDFTALCGRGEREGGAKTGREGLDNGRVLYSCSVESRVLACVCTVLELHVCRV